MRNIKRVLILMFFLVNILLITACNQGTANPDKLGESDESINGDSKEIVVSVPNPEDSHHGFGIKKFGEELEELTDGRITIDPRYNNELGGEKEVIEGMGIDTVDAGLSSTGPFGGFDERLMIFDLPYLFESNEHAYKVLDGEIGEELEQILEESVDIKVLTWMENGWRHNTNSVRALETPDDLKNIKHRTQESEVQIDTWEALGANPTPMEWPEVFTSLQQGVIDSQDNPLATIYPNRFYEVQNYLNLTQHVYSALPFMMSKTLFDSFSDEDQEAIMEAAEKATLDQREYSREMEEELIENLEEKGMEVIEPDLDPFKDATEPLYEKWESTIGEDLIEKVQNEAE